MAAVTSATSAAAAALSIRSPHRSAAGGGMPPGSAATAAANRAIRSALSSEAEAAIGLAGTGLGIIGLLGGIAVVIDLMTFTSCGGGSRCGAGFADAVRGSLTITGTITDRGPASSPRCPADGRRHYRPSPPAGEIGVARQAAPEAALVERLAAGESAALGVSRRAEPAAVCPMRPPPIPRPTRLRLPGRKS